MPNDKEIRKIMEKARKATSTGERTPLAKKEDKKLTKDKILEKKDKPIEKKKEGRETQPTKPPTEIQRLVNAVNQQNQRLDKIIGFQEKAMEQVETQMRNQASQTEADETSDQDQGKDGLTDEERLAQARAEQEKKTGKSPSDSGQPSSEQMAMLGKISPGLAYLYAGAPYFKETAETVRVAIAKGKAEKKEGSGFSFEDIGKDVVKTALERLVLGQAGGGGDNLIDQLKTFLGIQNAVVGGFFNSLKYASKDQAQTIMSNLLAQSSSPEIPPKTPLPSEDHII